MVATEKWYSVDFRGTAEMRVFVLASTPEEARQRAEDGNYESDADLAWVPGKPYTMKVRVVPQPPVEGGPL